MFARLRGIPERQIKEVVEIEVTRLDLKKHANKKCGTYRYAKLVATSYLYVTVLPNAVEGTNVS